MLQCKVKIMLLNYKNYYTSHHNTQISGALTAMIWTYHQLHKIKSAYSDKKYMNVFVKS